MSQVVRNKAPAPTRPNRRTTAIKLTFLMGETADFGFVQKRTVACLNSLEKSGSPLAVIFRRVSQRSNLSVQEDSIELPAIRKDPDSPLETHSGAPVNAGTPTREACIASLK